MRRILTVALFFVCATASFAQTRLFNQSLFLSSWEDRVRATSAQQPSWVVPVFTPSSGLVQLLRTDVIRQYTPTHTTTLNYGGGKGVSLIPWYKTELDVNLPPYIQHNNPKVVDGAGDASFLLKYRILAANEKAGTYSISAGIAATAPTGSYKNGGADGTISPTVYLGKGYRQFDVQMAASESFPTGHMNTMGRPISWNTAIQEKIGRMFWPEIEFNSVFFRGGPNDGKVQTFVSPGLMISKIKFFPEPRNRLALVFGAGEQIAVTHFHTYNHALSLSTRMVF
jgi:hypothetical protein